MKRIFLTIAYDGTDFRGFQRQDGLRTVEGELEAAIGRLTGETPELIGASRTDSGVHALENAVVFDTDSTIPPERFANALQPLLPQDLRAIYSAEKEPLWHPRKQNSVKTYEYYIYNALKPDPLLNRYSCFCSYRLDLDAMNRAAALLLGEHDFLSFANPDSQVLQRGGDAVRTLYRAEAERVALRPQEAYGDRLGLVRIVISGNGFLYHMVRILSGTLLEVGRGRWQPEKITEILKARSRAAAGPTLEARGLLLKSIQYL